MSLDPDKKTRAKYPKEEKETLKAIIRTAENGKYWRVLHGESSNNSLRADCWDNITALFNQAMNQNYEKKKVRDMYSKLKFAVKESHDKKAIRDRKLRVLCEKTGGGPSPVIADVTDPDLNMSGSVFSQNLNPVFTDFNKLTKPATTSVDIVAENAIDMWRGDFVVTTLDGTPMVDETGAPIENLTQPVNMWSCRGPMPSGKLCPRKDQGPCPLHGVIVARDKMGNPNGHDKENTQPVTPRATSTPLSSINRPTKQVDLSKVTTFQPPTIAKVRNEEHRHLSGSESSNSQSAVSQSTSSRQSNSKGQTLGGSRPPTIASQPVKEKEAAPIKLRKAERKETKKVKPTTINQGVTTYYEKIFKIQEKVSKKKETLITKKTNVEIIKIEILKAKAKDMGIVLPENCLLESEDDSDTLGSDDNESDDCDPFQVNL